MLPLPFRPNRRRQRAQPPSGSRFGLEALLLRDSAIAALNSVTDVIPIHGHVAIEGEAHFRVPHDPLDHFRPLATRGHDRGRGVPQVMEPQAPPPIRQESRRDPQARAERFEVPEHELRWRDRRPKSGGPDVALALARIAAAPAGPDPLHLRDLIYVVFAEQADPGRGQRQARPRVAGLRLVEQLASYVEDRPDDDHGVQELIDAGAFDDHGRFIASPDAKRITARYGYDYDATVTPRAVLTELAAAARRNLKAAATQSSSWFVRPHKNEPYHIRIRDLSGDRALTIANEELELGGGTAELLELPTGAARCERCWATLREIQRSAGPDLVSPVGTLDRVGRTEARHGVRRRGSGQRRSGGKSEEGLPSESSTPSDQDARYRGESVRVHGRTPSRA